MNEEALIPFFFLTWPAEMLDQKWKCPVIQEIESNIYKLLNNKIFVIKCYDFVCTLNVI